MMKIQLTLLLLGLSVIGFAQGDADLFRFSKTEMYGSARFMAMGGAFGALGADLGSSQINPAGFARYSKTQANFSLGTNINKNTLLFNGTTTETTDFTVKPNSIGIVFVQDDSRNQSGYQFIQFGLGYNRIQDFTNSVEYKGYQFESLIESFAASAEGVPFYDLYLTHPFSSSLAWETYLINNQPGSDLTYVADLNNDGDQYHHRRIDTKGGMGEYYISLSGNFMNSLYVGANIGLRTIKYEETINHYEEVTDTTGNDLRSFNYSYNLLTKGTGLNAKLGVIYLPQDNFRIGLSLHTPTYYDLKDLTEADMTAQFNYGERNVGDSLLPYGDYKYRLRTPLRLVGSAAYVFGTRGCISADVEYLNYKWANLRSTLDTDQYAPYDFTIENAEAKKVLQSALNVRIGAELVFNSVFFVRGGTGFSTRAYNDLVEVENGWDKFVSAGLGYRWGQCSLDITARQSYISRNYFAFSGSYAEHNNRRSTYVVGFSYTIL